MRLLIPADPLSPTRPDPAFEDQVIAANAVDLQPDLLDLESLLAGSPERALRRVAPGEGVVVYRGWMIDVERYEQLDRGLRERGLALINDADAFAVTHHLPKAMPWLEEVTPRTAWLPATSIEMDAVHRLVQPFGDRPIVVKDFVKSRKHEWDEACFIPNAADDAAVERVVRTFIERQGEDLQGGLVVREYVELEKVGRHPISGMPLGREHRLFVLDGELLAAGHYWDDVDYDDNVPVTEFLDVARKIPSRFFSVDVAKTSDGRWIVMEIGDGQVSAIPASIDLGGFYSALVARVGP